MITTHKPPPAQPRPTIHVGVVGSGVMGAGIAEVAARAGCQVTVVDTSAPALESARGRIASSLERAAARGQLAQDAGEVVGRISLTTGVEAVADASIVIEAIRESFDDKAVLLVALHAVMTPDALIATNTSSIPVARLAATIPTSDRVLGLHFFNPAPTMPVVELVPSLLTSPGAIVRAREFTRDVLRKTVVETPDRAGFLVNALLVPYLLSAVRALQDGVATREEIDLGMTGACGMPMGPLRLCDLIGIDTLVLVADSLYAEHLSPAYAAPSLLRRHAEAGLLGRKSGRGFYEYASGS